MIRAKTFFLAVIFLAVILAGAAGIYFSTRVAEAPAPAPEVLSFEDCEAAGYPVMESFPRQCATPDGRSYTEELTPTQLDALITYDNASSELITVSNPTPNSVTGKEFTVMGEARGTWYFEASFPIEVRSATGTVIATGIGQPVGGADWMTEEFVPFSAEIEVPESYIGEATLVLMNDNPSGLPENARSVSIPFTIEY